MNVTGVWVHGKRYEVSGEPDVKRLLVASLIERGAAAEYGRTWGSIKAAVEALGVKDDHCIDSVEVGIRQSGSGALTAELSDAGGLEIKEL